MNKIRNLSFLVLIMALLVGCTTSPQKKTEKNIKKYMKKTVPGYKSVSFSELDTFVLSDVKEYQEILDSIEYYKQQIKLEENFDIAKTYLFKKSDLKHIKNDMEKHYEHHKYVIKHNFKVKVDGVYHPFERDFMVDSLFRVD